MKEKGEKDECRMAMLYCILPTPVILMFTCPARMGSYKRIFKSLYFRPSAEKEGSPWNTSKIQTLTQRTSQNVRLVDIEMSDSKHNSMAYTYFSKRNPFESRV